MTIFNGRYYPGAKSLSILSEAKDELEDLLGEGPIEVSELAEKALDALEKLRDTLKCDSRGESYWPLDPEATS